MFKLLVKSYLSTAILGRAKKMSLVFARGWKDFTSQEAISIARVLICFFSTEGCSFRILQLKKTIRLIQGRQN